MASPYGSDTNILAAIAAMGVRQENLAEKLDETEARHIERLEALGERLDERHEALLERLDAREAARDAAMRVFVRDVVREALEPVHGRLDTVEKKQQKLTYAAGGMTALVGVIAWLWEHVGQKLLPVLGLLFMAGCAAPTVSRFHAGWPSWRRPVRVAIASDVPAACISAVHQAVAFWKARGVGYLHATVVPAEELPIGRPQALTVAVVNDSLPTGLTGLCRPLTDEYGARAMEIRLGSCRTQTAVHELAHALGLGHVDDAQNLMYFSVDPAKDGPWGLTPAQVKAVR